MVLVTTTAPRSGNGCSLRYYRCSLERSNHLVALPPEKLSACWSQTGTPLHQYLRLDVMPRMFAKQRAVTDPKREAVGVLGSLGAVAVARAVGRRRTAGWPRVCGVTRLHQEQRR